MTQDKTTVSAIAVIDLAKELLQLNVIDKPWLKTYYRNIYNLIMTSKPADILNMQELRLPEGLLIALWQHAQAHSPIPHLGFLIGKKVNINAKGVLANWISQCANFSEAFSTFTQHIALLNPSESWKIKDYKAHFEVYFEFKKPIDYPFAASERSLVAFIAWSEFLTNRKLEIINVNVSFAKPIYAELYSEFFGENICYNASNNYFTLKKSVLDYPVSSANHYLKHIMNQRAQELLDKLGNENQVTIQVIALLKQDLSTYCQQDQICNALHMSRATLYRKLKKENTSFSQLLAKTRIHSNKKLKNKGLSVSVIASLLGYQDVSTYYKKFKNTP